MQLVKINPQEEYKKSLCSKEDDELLDFVFRHRLFPRSIYLPEEAFPPGGDLLVLFQGKSRSLMQTIHLPQQVEQMRGYLFALFNQVRNIAVLKKRNISSAQKMIPFLFGEDVKLKNQDEIVEEKGEILIAESRRSAHREIEKNLSRLYPEEKSRYLELQGIQLKGQSYYLLLQVAFRKVGRLYIEDTLPNLDGVILSDEKAIIYPMLEDILKIN